MRFRYWIVGGAFLSIAAACALDDVDFTNKACPCGAGFVCDSVKQICVLPENVTPATEAGPVGDGSVIGCTGETCPCTVDGDCKEAGRTRCSPAKVCVECLADNDNCPPGLYCNASSQCTPGCKTTTDCQISPTSPKCNTTKHQCVECLAIQDCAGGKLCSPSGSCVDGCNLDAGVGCDGGSLACCGGFCTNIVTEKENCGGCGVVCSNVNGTGSCQNKNCTWQCAAGFAHCNGTQNTGCETPTRSVTSCGSCGNLVNCTTAVQNANTVICTSSGSCNFLNGCKPNFDNCNFNPGDGCECTCGGLNDRCCSGNICNAGLDCKPPLPNTCK